MEYKEITSSELGVVRAILLEQQGSKCAICQVTLDPKDPTNCHVDHQHLFKSEELGVNGAGLIRGVLCRDCNALEGKIWNAIHRFQKTDLEDPVGSRSAWVSNLLAYWNSNHSRQERILHPKERRIERLQKSEYNRLIKVYKLLTTSYKKDGTLKEPPKFTGRWSPALKKLKEIEESGVAESLKILEKVSKTTKK